MNTNVFFKVHSIGHPSPDVHRGYGLVSEECGCLHEEEDTIDCYQAANI